MRSVVSRLARLERFNRFSTPTRRFRIQYNVGVNLLAVG
jgi:hypothetical protein